MKILFFEFVVLEFVNVLNVSKLNLCKKLRSFAKISQNMAALNM